ncbi:MAG: hypothetical protein A2289_12755 [Deltaproteobacteria bacterium RIFOXYA12_FULL_58_15]|nr:MAG: hypothetical protein A2289_12755 [Deltaproteobacteria bacterium RIFOXYA12_FULL_58_15]OGR14209.1 MAG: hypothetical protein A2341_13345 [Deltaproteobacteria bacterium RIFOXYB12_FULL_58_9]
MVDGCAIQILFAELNARLQSNVTDPTRVTFVARPTTLTVGARPHKTVRAAIEDQQEHNDWG